MSQDSKTRYTPGPWACTFDESRRSFDIHQQDGAPFTHHSSDVATVLTSDPTDVLEANARLIAAAPELLEALEAMDEAFRVDQTKLTLAQVSAVRAMGAAIAKAAGGAA